MVPMPEEVVDLRFDHKQKLVRVDKQKGDEREVHSEKFTRVFDPVTAVSASGRQPVPRNSGAIRCASATGNVG